jgi:hypothetical protein
VLAAFALDCLGELDCGLADVHLGVGGCFEGEVSDALGHCVLSDAVLLDKMGQVFQPYLLQPAESLFWVGLSESRIAGVDSKDDTLHHPQNGLLGMRPEFLVAVGQDLESTSHGSFKLVVQFLLELYLRFALRQQINQFEDGSGGLKVWDFQRLGGDEEEGSEALLAEESGVLGVLQLFCSLSDGFNAKLPELGMQFAHKDGLVELEEC